MWWPWNVNLVSFFSGKMGEEHCAEIVHLSSGATSPEDFPLYLSVGSGTPTLRDPGFPPSYATLSPPGSDQSDPDDPGISFL